MSDAPEAAPARLEPPGQARKLDQLRQAHRLPSPKGVALAIIEVCRREDAGIDDIARIARTDPALASRLLRLANSAARRHARPAASVAEAVARIGLNAVRQAAMGFSLVDQYATGPCRAFDYGRFWSHSLLMGAAMEELAERTRAAPADEMFACGLMARIGCLALATIYPAEYANILESGAPEDDLAAREREFLEIDHNDVTAAILADSGIPKALAEPVFHHEAPDAAGFAEGSRPHRLAHLLYHAKRIADLGVAAEADRGAIVSELIRLGGRLGLADGELNELTDRIIGQWHEWGELLKVASVPLPPFAAMVDAPAPKAAEGQVPCPPLRVLLVEDEPTTRLQMKAVLAGITGREVHTATDGKEGLARALEVMPQVVVTDWLMPVMDGIEFCRALRATEWGRSMYVIMLTAVEDESDIVRAFEAGVDDYVTKPVNLRAMSARMRAALHYVQLLDAWERDRAQLKQLAAELAVSNRRLEHSALTDLLTGLPNRRAGMDTLARAWSAANRSGQGLAVMMVDIDRFKDVNDTHGHAVGDRVLAEVGQLIRASARRDDHVSRVGGEEFLVICQNADLKSAVQAAERLRQRIRGTAIPAGALTLQASVSIGVAGKESTMADADSLVAAADRALYAAKRGGRDRTCLHSAGRLMMGGTA